MTTDNLDLCIKFLKLKHSVIKGTEFEDTYDFLVNFHEFLHLIDIVERFTVKFWTNKFQGDSKMGWRFHVECQQLNEPPMTWKPYSSFFFEKYIPRTLRNIRRDEFLNVEQKRMSIAAYDDKFHALFRYVTVLFLLCKSGFPTLLKGLRSNM